MTKSRAATSAKKSKDEAPSSVSARDPELDHEDDEAPDTVSFNQGREEALESISSALRDLQRNKLLAKERRRKRDTFYKEQRQNKKVSLSKARLPPELLNKLGQQQESSPEQSEKSRDTEQQQTDAANRESEEDFEDASDEDDFDAVSEEGSDDTKHTTNIRVIESSKIVHPPPHAAALQFLKNQMYGKRIPRESMTKNISRKLKRLEKPGLNFSQKRPQGMKRKKKKK